MITRQLAFETQRFKCVLVVQQNGRPALPATTRRLSLTRNAARRRQTRPRRQPQPPAAGALARARASAATAAVLAHERRRDREDERRRDDGERRRDEWPPPTTGAATTSLGTTRPPRREARLGRRHRRRFTSSEIPGEQASGKRTSRCSLGVATGRNAELRPQSTLVRPSFCVRVCSGSKPRYDKPEARRHRHRARVFLQRRRLVVVLQAD